MFGRTLIFSGGKTDIDFAADYLKKQIFDTVVCADSGLNAAYRLGVHVDYILGDFDSVSDDILQKYRKKEIANSKNVEFIQYPAKKDATDTHLVLSWIVSNKPSEIVILGATGGRLDHFLANINILIEPLKNKIRAYIIDNNNKLYCIDEKCTFKREDTWGKYISFQPLTEEVINVCLKGFKYPLYNKRLTIGDSLAISNEIEENCNEAEITFDSGILIVVESHD